MPASNLDAGHMLPDVKRLANDLLVTIDESDVDNVGRIRAACVVFCSVIRSMQISKEDATALIHAYLEATYKLSHSEELRRSS